jgi:predicted MFS family arabinose efflux permease
MSAPASRAPGATTAVVILTAMNLLNYLDRFVPSAVKDLFKADLGLTDAETAWPLTAFVVVYMIASPIFGSLADKAPRKVLIAAGVALWSLATAAAALATGFWSLLLARSLVGVGEAAYATLAPPLLSDFFPPERRNRVLTIFYVAIPVGAAAGFVLGGLVGQAFGWRAAFLVAGLPGLLAALACLRIQDPGRGAFDGPAAQSAPPPGWGAALRALLRNPLYLTAVAGYTAVTWASGGMADWFPTFLVRTHGYAVGEAGSLVGTLTVVGGLGGTAIGGWLGDRLRGRTRQPYLALSALSMVPAAVFAGLAMVAPKGWPVAACMLLAQFFLWFYNGPINTILANSTDAGLRARAFAFSIFAIHIFGDAISPTIIGALSDRVGLGTAVALIPAFLALGALIWAVGWRTVPEAPAPGAQPA